VGTDVALRMPWALLSSLIGSKSDAVHCARSATTTQPRTTFVMSNILQLNCWAIGDDPRHVIPIKIASSETVGTLKKAIKVEIKHSFKSLDLWKVSNH
jgi:Crinkler effector protein N-terminal domain